MRFLLAATLALTMFVVACGGDSDEKQIRAVVDQQIEALNKGDGTKLYDVFSQRCRDENPKDAFVATVKELREELGDTKFAVKDFSIVEKQAESAKVRFLLDVKDAPAGVDFGNDPVQSDLIKESGKWRSSDCSLGVG